MMHNKIFILICCLIPSVTIAQDVQALALKTSAKTKKKKQQHWKGSILLGYTSNTGNTENDSFLGQFNLKYKRAAWENKFKASKQKIITDEVTTTDKTIIANQLKYSLEPRRYLFGNINYTHDSFAAYIEVLNIVAGYGWRVIDNKKFKVDLQVGPGYQYNEPAEDQTTGKTKDQHLLTANASGNLIWHLTKNTDFTQELGTVVDKDNRYYESSTALKTKVVGNLGMEISYQIEHNTTIPQGSNKKNTDTTTNVGFVYEF